MQPYHILESQQFTPELIWDLFRRADNYRTGGSSILKGKILATLFYEPSTRTRLSFESAMLQLGGGVISTENAREFSSAVKGESLQDTIRIVASYAHCIALRHYEQGAAKIAASVSPVPIINAGDGKGQHPTQALLDLYTIHKELGRIENLNITFVGDLANGRTARSLCYLLAKFKNNTINFVSPPSLKMGDDIQEYLTRHNTSFTHSLDMNYALSQADVIYMTRIQKERMQEDEYQKAKGIFTINQRNLEMIRKTARILHPLPHVEEIDISHQIESTDNRIAYFRQAQNGLFIRMALLSHILSY